MKIEISWARPLPLSVDRRSGFYSLDLTRIPDEPGVYIFGRKWGSTFEALYVGQAQRLRGRIKTQLNNLRLMSHLQNADSGKRIVLVGAVTPRGTKRLGTRLDNAERAFIRHYLAEGHDLVNKMGTKIRRHEIESDGDYPKKWWPRNLFVEM